MHTATIPSAATLAHLEREYPPLENITRPTVPTDAAAYYLNRRPQTLRMWAMTGHPIRPVNVNGRLAWRVADLRKLLGVA